MSMGLLPGPSALPGLMQAWSPHQNILRYICNVLSQAKRCPMQKHLLLSRERRLTRDAFHPT